MSGRKICPVFGRCGGCQYLDRTYEEQLLTKDRYVRDLFQDFEIEPETCEGSVSEHYRHKVQMSFQNKDTRHILCGNYETGSHRLVSVGDCLLDHALADEIILKVRELSEKFHLQAYDEKKKTGVIRHVMVRVGWKSGEVMVILVTGTTFFPGKQNFVKELRKHYPQITTVVQNINGAFTSKVLGDRFQTIYGPGFIYDELLGMRFRLSPGAFYQVNPPQTEKLYRKALELADLQGDELLLDAYCGTGTIGLIASRSAGKVIGVDLEASAISDARINAKINQASNISFTCTDAGRYMVEGGIRPDVVIMDPPRSGSSEEFLRALGTVMPEKIVYISCGPDTQVRDIRILMEYGYTLKKVCSFDLFPWTEHVETVCLLTHS